MQNQKYIQNIILFGHVIPIDISLVGGAATYVSLNWREQRHRLSQ